MFRLECLHVLARVFACLSLSIYVSLALSKILLLEKAQIDLAFCSLIRIFVAEYQRNVIEHAYQTDYVNL